MASMMRIMTIIPPAAAHPMISPRLVFELEGATGAGGRVDAVVDGDGDVDVGASVDVEDEKIEEETIEEGIEVGIGELVAMAPCPEGMKEGDGFGVLVTNFAAATNWSYIGMEGGLMAPTMPDSQWDIGMLAWQKNQIGSVAFVISRLHVDSGLEKVGPLPANPLSNPPSSRTQGEPKVLCVTV